MKKFLLYTMVLIEVVVVLYSIYVAISCYVNDEYGIAITLTISVVVIVFCMFGIFKEIRK